MPTEKPWWVPDRQTFNGAMVVLAIVIIAIYLVRVNGPGPESDALKILLGALIGGFNQIIGFDYGSSRGSERKDETQAKVAEKLAEKVSTPSDSNQTHPTTVVTTAPAETSTTPTITTVTTQEPKP